MSFKNNRVAVIIPARNEQPSIAKVVRELASLNIDGLALVDDIVVCDNGSTDNTNKHAAKAGAHVVHEFRQGYGYACLRALEVLRVRAVPSPNIVVFVDADNSVDPAELILLLEKVHEGYDLVVGNRENDKLEVHALSPHQRFGNWLASRLIRFIWGEKVSDLGPFRAIRYSSLLELGMRDQRFGWTVEMQVKVIQAGFKYAEVPVTTRRRIGVSKISGTVSGTMGAAVGIFGKVFTLYWQESKFIQTVNKNRRDPLAGQS